MHILVTHPETDAIRILIGARIANGDPEIQHFYVERRRDDTEPWRRSKKIAGDRLDEFIGRHGFDKVEIMFLLEEAAEGPDSEEEDYARG